MNYSKALLETIEAAQILAGHFESQTLDTWHILVALANNPYSVAGSVLSDYPMQIDDFQDAAEHITGQVYQRDGRYEVFPFSFRVEEIMKRSQEIAQAVHAKSLGTEHVLLALLLERGTLASQATQSSNHGKYDGHASLYQRWFGRLHPRSDRNGSQWQFGTGDWPGSRNLADDSDFEPQNEK